MLARTRPIWNVLPLLRPLSLLQGSDTDKGGDLRLRLREPSSGDEHSD